MLKKDELSNPDSCINRAKEDEMVFVLRGKDKSAVVALKAWIADRINTGKNLPNDGQIVEARACLSQMIFVEGVNSTEAMPQPEQVPYVGGLAASSKIAPFHLIPTVALESLANRFQKGIERKGDKSWNAISANQAILTDREFAIERISHIILHAQKLRDKLINGEDLIGDDDDAGAIMWAGAFFACVADTLNKQENQKG